MTYRTILVDKKEGYSIVTMHRPGEMNALSYEMRRELQDCFTRLEDDRDVRVIVLTGRRLCFLRRFGPERVFYPSRIGDRRVLS